MNRVGCGSHEISGWITAICAFDDWGRFVEEFVV